MTEKSTIAGLISKAAKKLHEDFAYIRETNSHSGEKGGETEDKVRAFLNGHIPKRFHATAGFVIDFENQMSDHQDVIIYDAQSSPVYRYEGNNQIVSADAVAAVIEVKSVLNKAQLLNAYKKIEEVKRLKKNPISEMDQRSTTSSLTTEGTLGVVLGFESDVDLNLLAEHCLEFNEEFETTHRPDLIIVLDVGVINYIAEFVGMRQAGDLNTATGDTGDYIPPCFVRLVARAEGAYALNRMFAHLVYHLAFYPRRPSIPPPSVLLEGTTSITRTLGVYQFNTENRLVRWHKTQSTPAEQNRVIKIRTKASKEELATLTYIPWQDGGVIQKKGKIPLAVLLVWFSKSAPRTVRVDDSELSMVMKITRPDFEKWPLVIERQSDFTAQLESPSLFETREVAVEGTGEPFMARIILGIIDMASSTLSQDEKAKFDEGFEGIWNPALSLRRALIEIRGLISGHREALKSGKIVRKAQADPLLNERIDGPLRSQTVDFLEMADAVVDALPTAMKFFKINIEYLVDREQKFARGCERNEQKHPELVVYLRKLRPTILEVQEQFKEMRYGGWNLPNVRYEVDGKTVTMVEPKISGECISEFVERIFSVLALAVEEIIMYGFTQVTAGSLAIAEIPIAQRVPSNVQRFRRTFRGVELLWEFRWTGKGFYDS